MAKRSNIRRRGKSWVASGRVNGQQFWRSFRTRDEAELFLARQVERRARGQEPERHVRVKFAEAAESWYETRGNEKGWSPSTRRDYRSALNVHLLPAFGNMPLNAITPRRIEAWRTEAMTPDVSGPCPAPTADGAEDARDASRHLRARPPHLRVAEQLGRRCRARQAELRRVGQFLLAGGGVGARPCRTVGAGRSDLRDSRVRRPPPWRACRAPRPRRGLCQPRAPRRGQLRARRAQGTEVGEGSLGADGGRGREGALAHLLVGRDNPDVDELVFPGSDGGYLDASALRRRYMAAQKKAGLRPLRFHDLRHTFGTLAVNRASILQVQAWMGHADIKTTMRYLHYKSHADDAALLDGAFAVTAALDGALKAVAS